MAVKRFGRNARSALLSLLESKSRTLLSATGIMVGATAIVLLISIAKGVQSEISNEVRDLGVNLVIILPARIEEDSMFAPGLMGISYLRESHVEKVQGIDGIQRAVPLTFVGNGLRVGSVKSPTTLIIATKPDWFKMRPVRMKSGRTLEYGDRSSAVCVIGSIANKKLFPNGDALGKSIDYNGTTYRIVGVTEDREQANSMFSMGSFENVMYVPYEFMRSAQPTMQIDRIIAQTDPSVEPKSLVARLDSLLGKELARETYSVVTQEDLLKILFKVMEILTWLLTGLTSIALFVGGVGIMTVMLMSVNERVKEIGIRKTVGAFQIDVFQQFLVEAMMIGLLGSVAGLGLSAIASGALRALTPIKPLITFDVVLLAFGVCLGVGAGFGILPAIRAAKSDPVVSLRAE